MKLRLSQGLLLQQRLTPYLIQKMRLFQGSYQDIASSALDLAQENSFLEVIKYDDRMPVSDAKGDVFATLSYDETLPEFLRKQIRLEGFNSSQEAISERIIEALDDRGYVIDFPALSIAICQELKVSARHVANVLERIQSLEPDGVAARSLKECLMIQLKQRGFDSIELEVLFDILISQHLPLVEAGSVDVIAKKMDLKLEAVEAMLAYIKETCQPFPAQGFSSSKKSIHLLPSFEVHLLEGDILDIRFLEEERGLELQFNKTQYQQMLKQAKGAKETQFLKEHYQKAKLFVEQFEERRRLLKALGQFMCHYQKHFFLKGDKHLKALQQKDLAEDFDVSPSTISRLLSAKYVQFGSEVFPLSRLCAKAHLGRTKIQLQEQLNSLFDMFPQYSDQKIANLVVNVERATVPISEASG